MSKEAALYRVMHGIDWLNKNVPGWFDRAKKSARLLMMDTADYDILGISCHGMTLNGRTVYTSGDVGRAARDLDRKQCGIMDDVENGITYYDLNTAWREVLTNPSPPRGYTKVIVTKEVPSSRLQTFMDTVLKRAA